MNTRYATLPKSMPYAIIGPTGLVSAWDLGGSIRVIGLDGSTRKPPPVSSLVEYTAHPDGDLFLTHDPRQIVWRPHHGAPWSTLLQHMPIYAPIRYGPRVMIMRGSYPGVMVYDMHTGDAQNLPGVYPYGAVISPCGRYRVELTGTHAILYGHHHHTVITPCQIRPTQLGVWLGEDYLLLPSAKIPQRGPIALGPLTLQPQRVTEPLLISGDMDSHGWVVMFMYRTIIVRHPQTQREWSLNLPGASQWRLCGSTLVRLHKKEMHQYNFSWLTKPDLVSLTKKRMDATERGILADALEEQGCWESATLFREGI